MSDDVSDALEVATNAMQGATDINGCVPPSPKDRAAAAVAAFLREMHAREVKARPFGNGTFRLDDLAAAVERAAQEATP